MTTEEFLAERRLRAAELALESARRRVAEADGEIASLRRQVAELEEKGLAAAERAGGLKAELEQVRRRAAEFEQEVRLAVDAAWRWLGETGERVSAGLAELDALRAQLDPGPDPEDELLWRSRAAPPRAPAEQDDAISGRFDEALSRLRSQADSPAEPAV